MPAAAAALTLSLINQPAFWPLFFFVDSGLIALILRYRASATVVLKLTNCVSECTFDSESTVHFNCRTLHPAKLEPAMTVQLNILLH
jgi:hypothetical protein